MQVFGLPGHLIPCTRSASHLLAARTADIEAERRRLRKIGPRSAAKSGPTPVRKPNDGAFEKKPGDPRARAKPDPVRAVQVDGGSEFMAAFERACAEAKIPLSVLRPGRPSSMAP